MQINGSFGALLRHHRREADLSQAQLAKLVGYNHATLSRLERDQLRPTPELVEQLVTALALNETQAEALRAAHRRGRWAPKHHPVPMPTPPQRRDDWGEAPDVALLYGREAELATLRGWAVDEGCRLLGIFGAGGIGKTALATRLAHEAGGQFECVLWRSLRNAPLPQHLLRECVDFLADAPTELPVDPEQAIALLLKLLDQPRCLLVLDNLEGVLVSGGSAGRYRPGYEVYEQLLRRVGAARHRSCLVLTSREQPHGFARLLDDYSSVRSLPLDGLAPSDGLALLARRSLHGETTQLATLVTRYNGNPLQLRIVAEVVREAFGGDVGRFLQGGAGVVGDISDLLDQQLARLTLLERDLLDWLAIKREPTTPENLRAALVYSLPLHTVVDALADLRRRSLIEQTPSGYTLQNVVMEYVSERLIACWANEIRRGVAARLISHALLEASSRDYVRESQARVLLRPLLEQLVPVLGQQGIVAQLHVLLAAEQAKGSRVPSYLGGNAFNLLVQLPGGVAGCDFSDLAVWQADARGVELHGVQFTRSDLRGSLFNEPFNNILSIALSPDHTTLALGTMSGHIYLYQLATGALLQVLTDHTSSVTSLCFSANGLSLASGSNDQTARIWDLSSAQTVQLLQGHTAIVVSVAFLSPEQLITVSEDQTVRIWDGAGGHCVRVMQGPTWWSRATLNPASSLLACACYDRNIWLWDCEANDWRTPLQGHHDVVWALAFSPDGTLLASSGYDQTVRVWEVASGRCLYTWSGHTKLVMSVAWSPDGALLASGGEDWTIRLWNVAEGSCRAVLHGHANMVSSVAFGADAHTLFSGSRDGSAKVWDVAGGRCVRTLGGYNRTIRSLAWSRDGSQLWSGGEDATVRLWNVADGACVRVLRGHSNMVHALARSTDGRLLASGGTDRSVQLWNIPTGERVAVLDGQSDEVVGLDFSPNGALLAIGTYDYGLKIWDVSRGCYLPILHPPVADTNESTLRWSPDGALLARGGQGGTLQIWKANGALHTTLHAHYGTLLSVDWSPDGTRIATSSTDYELWMWDVAQGTYTLCFRDPTASAWCLAWSPDGTTIAAGFAGGLVRLLDPETTRCIAELPAHRGWTRAVAWSPDGTLLATTGDDGTINVWDVQRLVCVRTIALPPLYAGCDITGAIGLSGTQRQALLTLGAVEYPCSIAPTHAVIAPTTHPQLLTQHNGQHRVLADNGTAQA